MSSKKVKVTAWECRCERCGHEWQSLAENPPARCASAACKSPYWRTKRGTTPTGRPPKKSV